jgi:hypothetical protein
VKLGNSQLGVCAGVAAAVVAFALPAAAHGTTNLVPNPGFEQGDCGMATPVCGWKLADGVGTSMYPEHE